MAGVQNADELAVRSEVAPNGFEVGGEFVVYEVVLAEIRFSFTDVIDPS